MLMKQVYPKLKEYAMSKFGALFQVLLRYVKIYDKRHTKKMF